jgi:uncharacterized protein (DUF58 family)
MTDDLVVPAGRQGPGSIASASVATLDLALVRRSGGALAGDWRSPGVGAGTELAQLRPYEPGDDLRQLDPAASARTAVAHVRQHVPERALTTWIVLDLSASMAFGTARRLKCDVAQGATEVLARVGIKRGGRVALLTCGALRPRLLPPRGGRRALANVRRLVSEGVAPDGHADPHALYHALVRVRRLARQPGAIVLISDFRGQEGWERAVRGLALRHTVLAAEIVDPLEGALPNAGRLVLVDPETGRDVEADTGSSALRARFSAIERARRATVSDALRRAGATRVELSTAEDWLPALARGLR